MLVTLSIWGPSPLRINVLIIDKVGRIIARRPVQPPTFTNYLEAAILVAYKEAVARNLAFDADACLFNFCYVLPADLAEHEAHVQQRLYTEGVTLAQNGQPESACWHPKQREGWRFTQELSRAPLPF